MRAFSCGIGILMVAVGCGAPPAPLNPITVDGSSTVYPLTEAAAELFEKTDDATVSVAFTGTVEGFGRFCRGQLDIVNASRPISMAEQELCDAQGVAYIELPVAHDAVTVIVHAANTWATDITIDELRTLWEPDAEKRITRWNQLRASWPDREIALFGPGTESGTFEFFTQVINGTAARSRRDYTASGDDRVIVQGVAEEEGALGYVGFSYFDRERQRLKAVPIDDLNDGIGSGPIAPTPENVSRGTYRPLGRPLLIYVNAQRAERPEVRAFARSYVTNARQLAETAGAVPLMPSTHKLVEERLTATRTGTIFDVPNLADAWLDQLLTR
jgi:phosphate transport system substrate-binding protein